MSSFSLDRLLIREKCSQNSQRHPRDVRKERRRKHRGPLTRTFEKDGVMVNLPKLVSYSHTLGALLS